jgi:DNA polymerase III subunit epsilon
MEFVTIDFETATAQRDSPCELGLTFVENGKVIDTKTWLIKPRYDGFDRFNTLVHGIGPQDVAGKPEFDELWSEIKPLVHNKFLIAHNAGFDIGVLRKTLESYQLAFPTLYFSCSYIFSKTVWVGLPAYDLKTLCKLNKIEFKHHRAGPDSRATAELALKAFEISGVSSIDDFPEKLNTNVGQLFEGGYKPSRTRRVYQSQNVSKIKGDPGKHNIDSVFYGKTVVFTGALSSMVRSQAQQKIADVGGILGNGVTRETDFLIVGQQDYRVVGEEGMSSKQKKAIALIENGSKLEILSEEDFIKNL